MRQTALLLIAFSMALPTSARAVEMQLVGASAGPIEYPNIGTEITIELRMTNNNQTDGIYGLGVSAHGYADNLQFVSGRAVRRYSLGTDSPLINLAGTPIGTGAAQQRVLTETAIGTNGPRVQLALSADVIGHNLDESVPADPGLEGDSSPMFRLVFRVVNPGPVFIYFDSSYQGDLINLDPLGNPNSTEVVGTTFSFVPEPCTALLTGLGLAGLAITARRQRAEIR